MNGAAIGAAQRGKFNLLPSFLSESAARMESHQVVRTKETRSEPSNVQRAPAA
jgi:hypothetical protein